MDCCYPLKVSISEDMDALRKQIKFIRQVGANEVDFGDLPSVSCLKVMQYDQSIRYIYSVPNNCIFSPAIWAYGKRTTIRHPSWPKPCTT